MSASSSKDWAMKEFIREHLGDDPMRLLLDAKHYPQVDVPFAVEQIAARRQIKEKLPTWYANEELLFPSKLSAEQCSSEQTAAYKQRLVQAQDTLYDLTGGLGIDSFFFSQKVARLTYVERFEKYCDMARHNFEALQASNITVCHADATDLLPHLSATDVIYVDPARRGNADKRVYALSDCEPNLPLLLDRMLEISPKIIAKLSPMADIQHTLSLLPDTTSVHVLSVKNECKELLFVVERPKEEAIQATTLHVHCVNYTSAGTEQSFTFTREEEQTATADYAEKVRTYLYEPNASLLKAGAFQCLAVRMGVQKLHKNSHLYTSDTLLHDFPGRRFAVQTVYPFSGKLCKTIAKEVSKANLTVRNFPIKTEELRKRTKIKEGGECYLFATTLLSEEKVLIACEQIFG